MTRSDGLVAIVHIGKVYAGNTLRRRITVKDGSGNPIDITGWTVTVFFQFSQDTKGNATGQPDVTLTTPASGVVLTAPTSGIAEFTLTAAQSDVLPQAYSYEVEVTDTGANKDVIIEGQVEFRKKKTP